MIERLPTPWGLVRLGVAPDHPKHQGRLARVREDRRAARLPLLRQRRGRPRRHPRGAACGSTTPSSTRSARRPTGGSASPARTCPARGPRPSSSPGTTATPTSRTLAVRPRRRARGRGRERQRRARRRAHARARRARSSRRPTRPTRRSTRSSARALSEIVMLGRRGPAQAAFTTPELKELGELGGADVIVDPADLELDPASEAALEHRHERRSATSRSCASTRRASPRASRGALVLRFCVSPVAILGEERVEAIEIVRNELVADETAASARCRPTSARRSRAGSSSAASATAASRCRASRSTSARGDDPERRRPRVERRRRAGVYCAGWIKRGPSGVIGTNKKDATETVELLLEDARAGLLHAATRTTAAVEELLAERGVERRRCTRAGRRSTTPSARAASRTAARGSSSARGTSCSRPRSSCLGSPSFEGSSAPSGGRCSHAWSSVSARSSACSCGYRRAVRAARRRSALDECPQCRLRRLGLERRPAPSGRAGSCASARSSVAASARV